MRRVETAVPGDAFEWEEPLVTEPKFETVEVWTVLVYISNRDLRYRFKFASEEEVNGAVEKMTDPDVEWFRFEKDDEFDVLRTKEIISIEATVQRREVPVE